MARVIPDRNDDDDEFDAPPSRRRWRLLLGLLAAVLVGYWLSPYVGAARFALAANAGATGEVLARTDLPALRVSFARQIVRAYIARHPQARGLDPFARQVVAGVATGYVDALIAEHLTPEAIAALLSARGAGAQAGGLLGSGAAPPRPDDLAGAWELFLNSGFDGLTSFVVTIPGQGGAADQGATEQERYRLRFGLSGLGWKLRALELPQGVLARLADELKSRSDRGS